MKRRISTLALGSILYLICTALSCTPTSNCGDIPERVPLNDKDVFVPYVGNEAIAFLHNGTDTHVFIGQGKIPYYISESGDGGERCPRDFESLGMQFRNSKTSEIFTLRYERDQKLFTPNPDPSRTQNVGVYYKLMYKQKTFSTLAYDAKATTIFINKIGYQGVYFIGRDTTTNYVAYKARQGILSICIDGEKWELIP